MSEESEYAAAWLRRNIGLTITAHSTWASVGIVRRGPEDVTVVPLPTEPIGPSGAAAIHRAHVNVDGKPWPGEMAVRAELIHNERARRKRTEAMRAAHVSSTDSTAAKVLPDPWHTAEVTVAAHEVGMIHGEVTVALDLMPWLAPFETALRGTSGMARVARAVELAIPLFTGLDHIHRHNDLVHRDIHPYNVMFDQDHLVFIDWGIASHVRRGETSVVTEAWGKQHTSYMAPEARRGDGSRISFAADVWAMGSLLCEMACGKSPDLLNSRTGEILLPAEADDLPSWLLDVIRGLTAYDRGARLPLADAVELLQAAGSFAPVEPTAQPRSPSTMTTGPMAQTATAKATAEDDVAERRAQIAGVLAQIFERGAAGQHHSTVGSYTYVIDALEDDQDPVVRQHMAAALNNLQWTFCRLGQHAEAIAACTRLLGTFGTDPDPMLRQQVAIALNGRAYAKRALEQTGEALADWGEVISLFGGDPDLLLRQQVAMAMRDKALALIKLERRVEAVGAYTRLIESFEGDRDPQLRRQVAMALNNKRWSLYWLGQHAEAVASCTRLVDTFGNDRDVVLRQQVAMALRSKGLILDRLRRRDEATAAYGRLVDSFANDPDTNVQESVVHARSRLKAG